MFNYSNGMIMAVIGHYESEQYTVDIFAEILEKHLPELRIVKTSYNTNPINYL